MLDVIHLSNNPVRSSILWVRVKHYRSADLVSSVKVNLFNMFPCCCCSAMAWTRCCLGVWQKDGGRCSGWWLKAVHIFTEVTRTREKTQLLYAGCVHFTVDWLFWKLYGSYTAPRSLLSWKKPRNFSFDNMWPLRNKVNGTQYVNNMIFKCKCLVFSNFEVLLHLPSDLHYFLINFTKKKKR